MNRDREEIEKQLPFKLPGSNKKPVWERLSKRDYMLSQSMRLEAHKGCPLPAFHHTHSANYSQLAMEVAMIGCVPPLPAQATAMLTYHDPGGAATKTDLEMLTLKMINNHESSSKSWAIESRDQQNRHYEA
jgi:hypothetical protein